MAEAVSGWSEKKITDRIDLAIRHYLGGGNNSVNNNGSGGTNNGSGEEPLLV